MAQKQSALILSLGGAPETWHFIPGLPGLYHPQIPTPVADLDLTAERAKEHHADDGCPVSLVMITDAKAEEATAARKQATDEARQATLAARQTGDRSPEEQERINDQAAALTGQEG